MSTWYYDHGNVPILRHPYALQSWPSNTHFRVIYAISMKPLNELIDKKVGLKKKKIAFSNADQLTVINKILGCNFQ